MTYYQVLTQCRTNMTLIDESVSKESMYALYLSTLKDTSDAVLMTRVDVDEDYEVGHWIVAIGCGDGERE